ncbi:hypothetical protein [Amycolatopsis methanolica]|uniref:Two component transcriptional regulator, LuxR family n=1 Tax=Amycolatopsis methanolica 239 TaxID=1068978 RepID=A0A076MZK1_AMYME|nr:hypothetical protein [Amycolatopsis methanolica]AIJ23032.1 two component transcriptional regulator, LuxR family [Amycolatopsis methanolica 239]
MFLAGHALDPHSALQLADKVRADLIALDSWLDPRGHLSRFLITADPAHRVIALVRRAHRTPRSRRPGVAAGVRVVSRT